MKPNLAKTKKLSFTAWMQLIATANGWIVLCGALTLMGLSLPLFIQGDVLMAVYFVTLSIALLLVKRS